MIILKAAIELMIAKPVKEQTNAYKFSECVTGTGICSGYYGYITPPINNTSKHAYKKIVNGHD